MLTKKQYLEVRKRGIDLFGDEEKFQFWLQRPNFYFGQNEKGEFRKPIDMPPEEILKEIGRIEHGVY